MKKNLKNENIMEKINIFPDFFQYRKNGKKFIFFESTKFYFIKI